MAPMSSFVWPFCPYFQLKYASDDQQRHEVEIVAILSMNEAEIEETMEIVSTENSMPTSWTKCKA